MNEQEQQMIIRAMASKDDVASRFILYLFLEDIVEKQIEMQQYIESLKNKYQTY